MAFNHNSGHNNGPVAQMQQPGGPAPSPGWKELGAQRALLNRKGGGGRRTLATVSVILLIMVIFAGIRISAINGATNDQLTLTVGNQQAATIDLRQSFPISPYLLGTNVFPKIGSKSLNRTVNAGFMPYTPQMASNLKSMGVKLLRYPGGSWGETNILSPEQLRDFTSMLKDTGAQGMIQAHIGGPLPNQFTNQSEPVGVINQDLAGMAAYAGGWVDYMNNPHSARRTGARQNDPYQPVKFWSVGNEPDRLKNPDTKATFTVNEYVNAFIQYSIKMHQNDPTIQVFGPEISQYYGIGAGPFDAGGQAWMEGFLKGIGNYEKQHYGKDLKFRLLDGVSFHRYQLPPTQQDPGILLSSSNEWNYLLPSLREEIKRDLGREAPIALTEVNVTNQYKNANYYERSPGYAALWWADTLGTLMNQQVGYVSFFSATINNPYPLFAPDGSVTAMGRVMELFSNLQSNLVPLSIQRDPISVYATQNNKRDTVSLLFVNKSSSNQLAQINASTILAQAGPWKSLNVKLAAYGMVVLTMHRGGGAEAYSFIPPTKGTGTVAPLTSTVCGAKNDPVNATIPC